MQRMYISHVAYNFISIRRLRRAQRERTVQPYMYKRYIKVSDFDKPGMPAASRDYSVPLQIARGPLHADASNTSNS